MPRPRRPSVPEKKSTLTIQLDVDLSLAQAVADAQRQPGSRRHLILRSVPRCSTVKDVRARIEDVYGLLWPTYRLHYLDDAELPDSASLRREHINDGATLNVCLWSNWSSLIESCTRGSPSDTSAVMADICTQNGSAAWRRRRCWVATYMACHFGHFDLLCRLLESGWADINAQGPTSASCSLLARTPLHAAAASGQWRCLCLLLEQGAALELTDANGKTPQDLASARGRQLCDRTLKFCAWNFQKAELREKEKERPESAGAKVAFSRLAAARRAHQFADSSLRTWLQGDLQRLYMAEVPNPSPLPAGDCTPGRTLVLRSRCSSRLSASSRGLGERTGHLSAPATAMRCRMRAAWTPVNMGRHSVTAQHVREAKGLHLDDTFKAKECTQLSPNLVSSHRPDNTYDDDEDDDDDSIDSSFDNDSMSDHKEKGDRNDDSLCSKQGNWRFSRYTCFDPKRAHYLLPSGWRLRSFSEQGLQRGLHIRQESLPRPQSLQEPPKRQRSLSSEYGNVDSGVLSRRQASRSAPHLRGTPPTNLSVRLLTTGRTTKPFN